MTSLRSRQIADYFEAALSDLIPDRELTVALHLYFTRSDHIMRWRRKGEKFPAEFLARYRAKGLAQVWIHKADREDWQKYLNPEPAPVEAAPDMPEPLELPDPANLSSAAQAIVAAIKSPDLTEDEKKEEVAHTARETLREAAAAVDQAAQAKANAHARRIVQEVLSGVQDEAHSIATEIFHLSHVDPCFDHAVNVATYAVLFALAFGRIDISLMTDLALAGLLHDVGLSQVDGTIAATAMRSHSEVQHPVYATHVAIGLELLDQYGKDIPARVKLMIEQHHEKFDGSGYPKRLQGFHLDDVSQLLAMSELLESVCSGLWDGTKRTLGETLDVLDALEKARTFPEHFNPDVFSTVMKWTRNPSRGDATQAALDVVKKQTQTLVRSA